MLTASSFVTLPQSDPRRRSDGMKNIKISAHHDKTGRDPERCSACYKLIDATRIQMAALAPKTG